MAFLLEYKFYSEKCRILFQIIGGWLLPLALGITRNQSSSSTCVALHIQESKVTWRSWCIQNWTPFYYTGCKRENWRRQKYYSQAQTRNPFKSSLLFQYLKHLFSTKVTRFLCSSPATRCWRPPHIWNSEGKGTRIEMSRVVRSFSSRISYFLLFLWSTFLSSALSFPPSTLSHHSLWTEFTDAFHKSVLFPSLKPPHFDFSTSSHTDHTTSWKMLFHIPDTLRFH